MNNKKYGKYALYIILFCGIVELIDSVIPVLYLGVLNLFDL